MSWVCYKFHQVSAMILHSNIPLIASSLWWNIQFHTHLVHLLVQLSLPPIQYISLVWVSSWWKPNTFVVLGQILSSWNTPGVLNFNWTVKTLPIDYSNHRKITIITGNVYWPSLCHTPYFRLISLHHDHFMLIVIGLVYHIWHCSCRKSILMSLYHNYLLLEHLQLFRTIDCGL